MSTQTDCEYRQKCFVNLVVCNKKKFKTGGATYALRLKIDSNCSVNHRLHRRRGAFSSKCERILDDAHLARKHQYNLWHSSECHAWPLSWASSRAQHRFSQKTEKQREWARADSVTGHWCNSNSTWFALLIVFYSLFACHICMRNSLQYTSFWNGMECDTMCHRIQVINKKDLLIALLHYN